MILLTQITLLALLLRLYIKQIIGFVNVFECILEINPLSHSIQIYSLHCTCET